MSPEVLHWIEPPVVEIPQSVRDLVGGPSFLAEALYRRGLTEPEQIQAFLDPTKAHPSSPIELPDLALAVDRLEEAIRRQRIIGVWGDFDVDGQTATALLVQALEKAGARVSYYIPVRKRESHGVALNSLQNFVASGVELVLTCDTGVTAHEAASWARERGIEFVITDHHTLPEILPPATAVVNPQRLEPGHPLSPLCGVGVAYQVALELLRRAGRPDEAAGLLDLVALGTIADLAHLTGDNRNLVQRGLDALRSAPRPAIQAMLELADTGYAQLSEETVAFSLAPRLNALGRLENANPAVPFFLASSIAEARPLAARLEALNARRKMLCDQVFQAAQAQIQRDRSTLDHPVLLLYHPAWPSGVLGIVASRLADLYRRPVVLAANPPGELARASARSIEGIDITRALSLTSGLLANFGGHPMAAGFSLEPSRLPEFQRALDKAVGLQDVGRETVAELAIDAFIPLDQVTLQMVDSLNRLAPFGPGNPPLVFASPNLSLQNQTVFGKTGEHLRLIVEDANGRTQKVTWWQGAGSPLPEGRFDLAYSLRASTYLGQRSLEVEWIAFRDLPETLPLRIQHPLVEIVDEREQLKPDAILAPYLSQPDCLIFAEGDHPLHGRASNRRQLAPAATLVMWTVPPGRSELQEILEQVAPGKLVWIGVPGIADQSAPFLARLSGLVKYSIHNRQGIAYLGELAAACAQRQRTIRAGIEWLAARGNITFQAVNEDKLLLTLGGSVDPADAARSESELTFLLEETAAFRAFCRQANLARLLNPELA